MTAQPTHFLSRDAWVKKKTKQHRTRPKALLSIKALECNVCLNDKLFSLVNEPESLNVVIGSKKTKHSCSQGHKEV